MLFKNEDISIKFIIQIVFTVLFLVCLFFLIISNVSAINKEKQNIFTYNVKVQNAYNSLNNIFKTAEVNVNVLVDSISSSYDTSRQQNKTYNLQYIKEIDSLIKSVLANSQGVDGCWFQLNADLPFSVHAYNWFEYRDNQFINLRNQFEDDSTVRKITPDSDPYYFNAINNQKPVWSDVYTDADTKQQMMSISAPVYKNDMLIGVVGIDISIYNLQYLLENMQLILPETELFLLDKNNKIIISQLLNDSSPVKLNYKFFNELKESNEKTVMYKDNGTKKLAIMLLLTNGLNLVISVNDKYLFHSQNIFINMIFALYILLILTVIIVFILQYKVSQNNTQIQIEEITLDENDSDLM